MEKSPMDPTAAAAPALAGPRADLRAVFVVADLGADVSDLVRGLADTAGLRQLPAGHDLFSPTPDLRAEGRGWDTSRLGVQDAKPRRIQALTADWMRAASEASGHDAAAGGLVVSYDDIALHVPFLAAGWPGARFVHVEADPADARAAMAAGWEAGTHVTQPDLPDWSGRPWSYALVPGWRALRGSSVADTVAAQWDAAHQVLEHDLAEVPTARVHRVSSRDLAEAPDAVLRRVTDWLSSSPDPEAEPDQPSQLRSSSTASFAELLQGLGVTLAMTTYQSGYLVLARAQERGVNTHFRRLPRPMGTAYRDGLLTVGTKSDIVTYANVPQVAASLPPAGTHDAAFLPRHTLHTGDIRVHDLAWAQGQLWAVATKFSCLATFDGRHNFVPRWRPPFISELAAEDRCHLNGLAVVDDRVKYVTALGTGDTAGGWRDTKVRGGIIMDVETDQVVAEGLSMPHSPTWHRDQLWFLESGEGALARVDVATGEVEHVAQLPGFTRGLAFAGRYAFIGLSEVREANLFGGLPLTARLEERECGVWVVDLETGGIVAWLRFEAAVQEIYDVSVLPGMRWPEIFDADSDQAANIFMLPPAKP
jgi:uncharacterized protein (TIGR03032 family)